MEVWMMIIGYAIATESRLLDVSYDCGMMCRTCKSTNSNYCYSCRDTSLFPRNGECSCLPLAVSSAGICCHESCSACTIGNSASHCTNCNGGEYLHVAYTTPSVGYCEKSCSGYSYSTNTCFTDRCPERTVKVDNTCKDCPTNCSECDSEMNCYKCTDSPYYLLIDLDKPTFTITCSSTCPSGWLKEDQKRRCYYEECPEGYVNISGHCIECPSECEGCYTTLKCKKCKRGYYNDSSGNCLAECPFFGQQNLTNWTCVENCENGFAAYYQQRLCLICHSSCKTCSGIGEDECITCSDSTKFLRKYSSISPVGKCINKADCPKYVLSDEKICYNHSCPHGYFYDTDSSNCTTSCSGAYTSYEKQMCLSCHESCDGCRNTGEYNCIACADSSKILELSANGDRGRCVDPDGFSTSAIVCIVLSISFSGAVLVLVWFWLIKMFYDAPENIQIDSDKDVSAYTSKPLGKAE